MEPDYEKIFIKGGVMGMHIALAIVLIIVALLVGGAVGIFMGIQIRRNTAEKEIGSAEEEAKRIVADAIKTAEAKKKEYVLEGKDEVHRFRNESEKEINDRRKEVQRALCLMARSLRRATTPACSRRRKRHNRRLTYRQGSR